MLSWRANWLDEASELAACTGSVVWSLMDLHPADVERQTLDSVFMDGNLQHDTTIQDFDEAPVSCCANQCPRCFGNTKI